MQIIRTIVWVLVLIALLLFSINNWQDVEVKIWEGLILQTKLPALVVVSFLLGLLPMWLLHKGASWRWNRKIGALENTVRASSTVAPVVVTPHAPVETAPLVRTDPERPVTNYEH